MLILHYKIFDFYLIDVVAVNDCRKDRRTNSSFALVERMKPQTHAQMFYISLLITSYGTRLGMMTLSHRYHRAEHKESFLSLPQRHIVTSQPSHLTTPPHTSVTTCHTIISHASIVLLDPTSHRFIFMQSHHHVAKLPHHLSPSLRYHTGTPPVSISPLRHR